MQSISNHALTILKFLTLYSYAVRRLWHHCRLYVCKGSTVAKR